jgi:hypothetical protein
LNKRAAGFDVGLVGVGVLIVVVGVVVVGVVGVVVTVVLVVLGVVVVVVVVCGAPPSTTVTLSSRRLRVQNIAQPWFVYATPIVCEPARILIGVVKSVHDVALTCVDETFLPSMITVITGALPQVRCPRARTTTVEEAANTTVFDAVAGDFKANATPPDALPSRTELAAHDGETLIASASTAIEFAAVADGTPAIVTATAATRAVIDVRARAPRKVDTGGSADR